MFGSGLGFTHKEGVPMTVRTMDKVNRLGRSLYGTMEFDFEEVPQLLGNDEVFFVLMQIGIFAVLPQLDGVPTVGLFETWEPDTGERLLFGREEPLEGLTQPICQHLHRGGWHVLALSLESLFQLILVWERAFLLILLLDDRKHLIIEHARFLQTLHEHLLLRLIGIQTIFVCPHTAILQKS